MITLTDPLPDDLETAHQLIRELLKTLAEQIHLNEKLQHQIEQLLRQRYGPKGERIDPAQLLLFAQEILAQAQPTPDPTPTPEPDPAPSPTSDTPQKKGHGRKPLPASLPRRPVLHDVPPEHRVCPDCGAERTCIGQAMCDWMAVAAELLEPIVKRMLKEILASQVVQNDDTTVPVQDHSGKGIKTGRLWVSIGDHDHRYTVYTYTPDRSADGPKEIFKDFRGYLQADAYSAYDALYKSGEIVEVGCMMHARRKFYDARDSDPQRSHQALAWIRLLYKVEEEAKERAPADYEASVALRHELRSERSRPIFEKFHAWLEAEHPKVLPKSPIGEAIQYALNHWEALKRPLEAGFLELDNGECERAFKPVGIGRRNWLFAGSDKGGQTAAILLSLCATCKNLGIDPQVYLRDVLDRISTHPAKRIDELLPDRWQELRRAGDAAPD